MKYKIYKLLFNNKKIYIGYTGIGVRNRLHKHYTNAVYGIDTKLYRAIRKYGLESIRCNTIYECESEKEAKEKERFYIKKYNSFKNGYNMTLGGDGGDICSNLTEERYKQYIEKIRHLTKGKKNPNYSGFTDDYIIRQAVKFYQKEKKFLRNYWFAFCKTNGLPQSYSKNRFNGKGYKGLVEQLKKELKNKNISFLEKDFKYERTKKHRENAGKVSRGRRWYNNGKRNFLIKPNKARKQKLKKGRI
jgi:hypothetical protein